MIAAVVIAAIMSVAGGPKIDAAGGGLTGHLGSGTGGTELNTRRDFVEDHHGVFGIGSFTTHNSEYSAADDQTMNYFNSQVQAVTTATQAYAAALGLDAEKVKGFSKEIDLTFTNLDAAGIQDLLTKTIGDFGNDMITAAYGEDLAGLTKAGETSSQTLVRLATDVGQVNQALNLLGFAMLPVGIESTKTAAGLVDAFGGVERMQQVVGTYFETMYSEGERARFAAQGLKEQFAALIDPVTGLALKVPENDAAFRALVGSIDISTVAGQNFAAAVMALAPAFDQAAASAQAAAANMLGALQNYGTSQEVRDFQVDQIRQNLSNDGLNLTNEQIGGATRADARALWEQFNNQANAGDANARRYADAILAQQAAFARITPAMNDASAAMAGGGGGGGGGGGAAGAANDLASALQNLTDAMFEEVNRIRGIIPGQGAEGYAAARARLFAANDAAGLGDQDAMKALPQLSQAFLALAENNVSSSAELRLIQAQTAAMLENTATGIANRNGLHIPTFAGGGFHDGGWAMVGEMGPELAYLPPAHIYTASDTSGMLSGDGDSATASEMAQMRRENRILLGQVASLLNRQLKLSENWDGNGLPPERETS